MKKESKNQYVNMVTAVIQRSHHIKTHLDYFVWLQNSLAELIPHDMLLSVWGDFSAQPGSKLYYDAASNLNNLRTTDVISAAESVNEFLYGVYECWDTSDIDCFLIDEVNQKPLLNKVKAIFPEQLLEVKTLLVYVVRDQRRNEACLYLFFSQERDLVINIPMMDFIMPHVDHALRKIKPLEQSALFNSDDNAVSLSCLSEREVEVISWIKAGKTNQEIGMILNISQNTVKSHLKRIFQKLNIGRRAQAVALLANVPAAYGAQCRH